MGLFKNVKSLFTREKTNKKLMTLIREYYGDNVNYFAWNYAQNIYSIPEVRTAIETFAEIFATVPKYFIKKDKEGHVQYYENNMTRVLTVKPNPLQNATQFWVDLATRVLLHSNAFVEPSFDPKSGELVSLYVLPQMSFQFELTGENAYVNFINIGKTKNLKDLIYLNRFSSLSGGKKNELGLYETVIQALAAQAVNVANPKKPRALLQAGQVGGASNLKTADQNATMKELEASFDKSVQGIAYVDRFWQITPINWQENDVNRELMRMVINIVYNYFGITEEIINNKATEIEYQLFVKNKILPFTRQIEEEFTAKLFTKREIEVGNRLEFDTFQLEVSTLATKTAFFNVALRQGIINIDEARERIGYAPLENGLGEMYRVTVDTVDIELANRYQLNKVGTFAQAVEPPAGEGAKEE